jgi:hypothetical protein
MTSYPVRYSVTQPERFTRLQLLIRVVAFMALGALGLSFGSLFMFAFLALPVYAASRLAFRDDARAYLDEDGPRVVKGLHWFAALCAWAGLITDALPGRQPGEAVSLQVETTAVKPNSVSAILRALLGLPSALILMLLYCVGALVWLWAALSILVTERVGRGAFAYLVGLQRWTVRLLAYQASLVDEYPPFSFSDVPPALPDAGTTTREGGAYAS